MACVETAHGRAEPAKGRRQSGARESRGTDAKAAADATKPAVKKEEPMGKIEGTTLTRPNGLYLGLTLADGKFKLTFYDKKKKPTKVDVTRGLARWPNIHGPGDNRAVLNPMAAALQLDRAAIRPASALCLQRLPHPP